ncbi:MAG: DedA family protein [Sulfurifustis sp.]
MTGMTLEYFIQEYGYLAILIGTFIEGETIVVLGGLAAHLGYLDLQWVMLSAFAGSFFGDQLYFYIGRHYGPRIIAKRLSWQANAEKVYKLLRRHQDILILTFRFYYGLRNVTPFAIGASQVSRVRYFTLNFIGAIIWAITLGWLGYLFGEAFRLFLDDFHQKGLLVLGALVVVGAVIWFLNLMRARRRARERGL